MNKVVKDLKKMKGKFEKYLGVKIDALHFDNYKSLSKNKSKSKT